MIRKARERRTVRLMIAVFCRGRHGTRGTLCATCGELLTYADKALEDCPYPVKPACRDCKIHCYDAAHRQAIQEVMRYAGRRMLFRHPVAALLHFMRR